MDGFYSGLNGLEIDRALRNAAALTIISNGWAKIPSTSDEPISVNQLTTPGNYTVDYWTDGPNVTISPLNVSVFSLNGQLVQSIPIGDKLIVRNRNEDGSFPQAWGEAKTKADITIAAVAPTTVNEFTLWVDISGIFDGKVTFRLPKNHTATVPDWIEIKPIGTMTVDVYDPTNQAKDIFKHVTDTIAASGAESSGLDFDAHIKNADIHVLKTQMTDWTGRPTASDVTTKIDAVKAVAVQAVKDSAAAMGSQTAELATTVAAFTGLVSAHTGNAPIHPTAEKQADWDSKAASDHKHLSDGTVELDAASITSGVINIARIDKSALERLVSCAGDADRLVLTKEDAQNGDCVYVREPPAFYYVIDDTKLATVEPAVPAQESAFKLFSAGTVAMTWDNVANKPTTVAGYGITDVYTKAEVTASVKEISDLVATYDALASQSNAYATADLAALQGQITAVTNLHNTLAAEQAKIDATIPDILTAVSRIEGLL